MKSVSEKSPSVVQKLLRRITSMKAATFFMLVAGSIGLGFVIVTPPFQGWDEREHFYRAYQVSEFNAKSEIVVAPNAANVPGSEAKGYGGEFPLSTVRGVESLHRNEDKEGVYNYALINDLNKDPADFDQSQAVRFDNTAIYSPAGYVPQSFAIFIVNVFKGSFIEALYLARVFGLLFWIALVYLSIRCIPIGKNVFLVLALNPVAIFLAATLSPDAMAGGFIALTAALLLRAANQKEKMSVGLIVTIGLLMLFAVLIKNVYLPVILLLFMLPRSVLEYKWKAAIMMLCIIAAFVWNISILSVAQSIPAYFGVTDPVGAAGQAHAILDNPIKFIAVVVWNIFGTNSILVSQTYVGIFDRNPVPDWVVFVWILTLISALCYKEETISLMKANIKKRIIWIFSGVATAITGLVIVSLYLGWSIIGDKDIVGVQGRYFIPISFLAIMPFILSSTYFTGTHKRVLDILIYAILPFGLIATVGSLLVRYTVGS